ncbi:MAG: aldo/keto reductase, partial [Deltaproteobacteria bacterium]|nr:aldo/keto reductase [Deltaproteobacteria bacterium]
RCTPAQLSIAWCLLNPNVTSVITGASRVDQVRENLAAGDIVERLDEGIQAKISAILAAHPA